MHHHYRRKKVENHIPYQYYYMLHLYIITSCTIMSLYTNTDVTVLRSKTDEIMLELEKIKQETVEPTFENLKKAHLIVLNYCRANKRKLYGGFALHKLLIDKKKDITQGIYAESKIPDIDIYSPYPIQDVHKLCNSLFNDGFKYIEAIEALHLGTYTIKYHDETLCDLSYVPTEIYNKIPFIKCSDDVIITDPKFMTIDSLRMLSNPHDSYWRFFECADLKAFSRFVKLQTEYPLPMYPNENLKINPIKPQCANAIDFIIQKFLFNRQSTITVGIYAYNHFCAISGFETAPLPYIEFISVNYREDALALLALLKDNYKDITYAEHYPWFDYTDYSAKIYLDNDLICHIYDHNHRCTPYQDVNAYNYKAKKPIQSVDMIRLGSATMIYLYMLINAQRERVIENRIGEKFWYIALSHCIQMRNDYFVKYKKTFLDDTIFREFILRCIGEEIGAKKSKKLRIEKRKLQKKPLVWRYIPSEKYIETPPKFIFNNLSGNEIKNPHNLHLSDIIPEPIKDVDDDPDAEIQNEITNIEESTDNETDTDTSNTSIIGGTKSNNTYTKHIVENDFNDIVNGKKIYECRLNKGDFVNMTAGDIVVWENDEKTVTTKIISSKVFDTFADAVQIAGINNILPHEKGKSIRDAVTNTYHQLYTTAEETEHGVKLIKFTVQ